MKLFRTTIFIGLFVVLFCFPDSAYGQSEPKSKFKADSTWSEWNLRISPYVWLVGLKGQLTLAPEPAQLPWVPPPIEQLPNTRSIWDIDLSFKEVRHSLKFAVMLAGQYKFERIITQFNLSSLVMESNAIAPFDYIFKDNTLSFTYVGGDLGAGYRLIRNKKVEFDLLLGLKFIYFKAGLRTDIAGELPISVSLDRLWTEPVVGTNLTYRPHKRIELMALGDIGSTLLNPNLTYQFALNGNFLISKHIFVSAGYRNYYIKFPKQEAIFTGTMHGMLVKFGLQF